jgi:hypothetical protein
LEFWKEHKRYTEFRATPLLESIFDQKIQELVHQETIVLATWEELRWVNRCNLVPKSNGDMRLVVDMRLVNRLMKHINFKMEGVRTLQQLWEKDDFAIAYDLKEAYNHVPVHPSLQPIFKLAWQGQLYKYVGMPFGLSDAPRIFSLIMRKVIQAIRKIWNIKAVVYLDDLILLYPSAWHLKKTEREITKFLQWLGWTVNLEKSHLKSSRTFKYLGWEWDSQTLSVRLTDERQRKALDSIRGLRKAVHLHRSVTNRGLAKVIAILNAARLQFPMASLYLMKLHETLTRSVQAGGWDAKCFPTHEVMGELQHWTTWLKKAHQARVLS